MIEVGKKQLLTVVKKVDFGVYLSDSLDKEAQDPADLVLLPIKQVPEGTEVADSLSVFIYRDSEDRLINEGVQEKKQTENAEDTKKAEKTDESEEKPETENADKDAEKQAYQTDEKAAKPEIKYTEDLSGQRIVIRGYGGKQESISNFIYDIAHLSYINNAEITAIEEHKIENGVYNIFEITVTGGVYN